MGLQTARLCYEQPLNKDIFTACENSFETNPFCHASMKFTCHKKTLKFWLNSVYRKFFIYVHKNLFAPQTSDLLEKLALIFLYNFHCDHILLTLKIKKLSPKINVKNIKTRVKARMNVSCSRTQCSDDEQDHIQANRVDIDQAVCKRVSRR